MCPDQDSGTEGITEEGNSERAQAARMLADGGDRLLFRVTALCFFGVFLYILRDGLSPVLVGTALLCLLLFARHGMQFELGLGIVSGLLFGAWFISVVAGILWPFVLSFVLAYLLAPLVGLMARKISRTLAILIIALMILGAMFGIGAVVIPRIIDEVGQLVRQLPAYGEEIRRLYERLVTEVEHLGYTLPQAEIRQWFIERLPEVGKVFADQTTAALKGVTSGLAALLNLLMIPFVTFYVLKDYERIKQALRGILPRRYAESTVFVVSRVDAVLCQYVRGQLLVCAFIAVLTSVGLGISGIRYAVLLGTMAGVLNLVPYVGLAISLGVASVVALLDVDPFYNLIKVVVVFVVVQGVEGNFLSPRVVGQRVGLHPAWVMFALVVFAHFWGFLGMVVAIPAAAVVNILVKILSGRYYRSRYYSDVVD